MPEGAQCEHERATKTREEGGGGGDGGIFTCRSDLAAARSLFVSAIPVSSSALCSVSYKCNTWQIVSSTWGIDIMQRCAKEISQHPTYDVWHTPANTPDVHFR